MSLRVLDLFSGIGGFSLGLERAGMTTVAFCEIDPFCRRVLSKHWPDVPIFDDVRELNADRLRSVGVAADLIAGGFPCQDISIAGRGAGFDGERSGLWREFARLVGEVRPRYAVVENVPALLARGLGDLLRDLAERGYDAEWQCLSAAQIGAPHRRNRIWIVAYPHREGLPLSESPAVFRTGWEDQGRAASKLSWWSLEPEVGRMAHGVSRRVDRLRSLGNAVVSQIPELIGRAILAAEARA